MLVRKLVVLVAVSGILAAMTSCGDINHSLSTMDQVNDESKHLSKRTDDLERELVNKESNVTLSDSLDTLYGDGKFALYGAGNPAGLEVSEATMLQEAGLAVEAMHFQYWKGDYNEPVAVLDEFFYQALEVMFTKSSAHIPNDYNANILQPDRDFKAVASLASQLDRMRPEYAQNLQRAGLKNLSAYDVIVEALRNRGTLSRPEKLPKTSAMVLRWKQEAIYMLQLRQIYFPIMVLSRLTRLEDQKDFGWKFWDTRLWDAYVGGTLKIDLSTQDPARKVEPEQLHEYTKWLNQALATRQVLREICVEPQTNDTLKRILAKTDVIQANASMVEESELKLQTDFTQAYRVVTFGEDKAALADSCPNVNVNANQSAAPTTH